LSQAIIKIKTWSWFLFFSNIILLIIGFITFN